VLERVDEASSASIHAKECALQISFITAQIQKAQSALEFNSVRVATIQIFGRRCGRKTQLGSAI